MNELYGLDPAFERAVLLLCARKPRFWSRVGHALMIDCMELPEAKLVLEACTQIAREQGTGPASEVLVIQRLRRRVEQGSLTMQDVLAVAAVFDEADEHGLPPDDSVAAELAPLLRRRAEQAAIMQAHEAYTKRLPMQDVMVSLERAGRLGHAETSVGTKLLGGFGEMRSMRNLERLPTGVMELDVILNDGLPRSQLGVVLGGAGDGKSMYLSNQANEAVKRQVHTCYATLELPKPVVLSRLYAGLTGVPIDNILENDQDCAEAERRMEMLAPRLGSCFVEEFSPHATSVLDLLEWVKRCEDDLGEPIGCLCVDYADKLFDPRFKGDNEYMAMRYVYEGLRRDIAVAKKLWLWTGSQAGRRGDGKQKRIDLGDVSDSMHKVRVADLVVSLNVNPEGGDMTFFVAKNRTGKSRMQAGPIPTDFARGRIVPVTRELMAW